MTQAITDKSSASPARRDLSDALLRWAGSLLVATVWASATLFGVYILAFYAGAVAGGGTGMERWNVVLPRLYERDTPAATAGIGLHFAAGAVILLLGSIQFVRAIRDRAPALHRWVGRVYVAASVLAGLGGLTFIAAKGTVGGVVMDIGFGIYGLLMVLAAVETVRHARARRMEAHRAWAIRLYALAIGSWLYRMDYGFWLLLADGAGHTPDFRGWFDVVMMFFFYVPNLIVAETFVRGRRRSASPAIRLAAAAVLAVAAGFLLLGTYFFVRYSWGPAILEAVRQR